MRLKHILLSIITLVVLSSCSSYDKLVKGRDYQTQYDEALRYYSINKDNKAIALFDNIETIFSATDKIDTIKFYKARANYRMGDYYTAVNLMDEFRKSYSRSPFAEEAEYLYAMCYYQLAPGPELDQSNTALAINAFNEYIERYPRSARRDACLEMIEELQGRIYAKTFIVGQTYYNIGYYNSAIHSFKNMLKDYPEIPQREEILYLLVKANYQYAKASVQSKQRERYYNTIDAYYNFAAEYPESEYMPEVERMFRNAQRLAKGEEVADDVEKDFNLSKRQASKAEKKALRLTDKIGAVNVAIETLDNKVDKSLKKIEKQQAMADQNDAVAMALFEAKKTKALNRTNEIEQQLIEQRTKLENKLQRLKSKAEKESQKRDTKEENKDSKEKKAKDNKSAE